MYLNKYTSIGRPLLEVYFYQSESGREPVREWLTELPKVARKCIGEDIKTVQFGWPIGMPVVRKMEPLLWEVRSRILDGIARVLFTVVEADMILLHGFVKKSISTPLADLDLARRRLSEVQNG